MPSLSTIHSNLRYFPEVIPTCTNMSYHIVKKSKFIIFFIFSERCCEDCSDVFQLCKRDGMWGKDARRTENNAKSPTVKLLLTFFVLDSATLASVRSTSSKIMDWKEIQNPNKFLDPTYKQQTQRESA